MKRPMPAPDVDELLHRIQEGSLDRLMALLTSPVDDHDYLHWNDLRYKTPPEGLTTEEWWVALKLQRRPQKRHVPLRDKQGKQFHVVLTDRILKASEEVARRAGGWTLGPHGTVSTANRSQYLIRSLTEEAIRSSQLEGASTSRRIALEMIESERAPRSKSEQMIFNNYAAMMTVKDRLEGHIEPEHVLELHRTLVADTLDDPAEAGRLETPDHPRVKVWDDNLVVHEPPPAEELPERLDELCRFANGEGADETYLPPVVRAIIIHFMFGYDHYFVDGNGRMARAMFYWSLLRNNYWLSEYVSISRILRGAPSRYSRSYLYTEDDGSDLTYFVHYQLDVLLRAIDDLDEHLAAKAREDELLRRALQDPALNDRQVRALESLAHEEDHSFSAVEYANRFRVTDQTARNDLTPLTARGLVTRFRAGRAYRWRATPHLIATLLGEGSAKLPTEGR